MHEQSDKVASCVTAASEEYLVARMHRLRNHSCPWWVILLVLTLLAVHSQAQPSSCGCQPTTYTFTFDFGLLCDDSNIEGPGIKETACITNVLAGDEGPLSTNEDLVPVSVYSIRIFELNQNMEIIAQTVVDDNYADGSDFTYTSILSSTTRDSLGDSSLLPGGLQVSVSGLNSKAQSVVQIYIIQYTNECGVVPVLAEGQSIGWTLLTRLGDPSVDLCIRQDQSAPIPGATTEIPPIAEIPPIGTGTSVDSSFVVGVAIAITTVVLAVTALLGYRWWTRRAKSPEAKETKMREALK